MLGVAAGERGWGQTLKGSEHLTKIFLLYPAGHGEGP